MLERSFDLSNLPRNYIWTLGYLGEWPHHPEQAEISAQVKSYSKDWLLKRAEEIKEKQAAAERKAEEFRKLQEQRKLEDLEIARKEYSDLPAIKRRIEAGPLDMAKGLLKTAGQLASGGTTDPTERMAICTECPFMGSDKRCGKCGCFLPAKTRVAKSSCPIGLW
ncbi:MAG: hypothetical protein ACO3GU_02240 [Pelagibacteraceae bacterium]